MQYAFSFIFSLSAIHFSTSFYHVYTSFGWQLVHIFHWASSFWFTAQLSTAIEQLHSTCSNYRRGYSTVPNSLHNFGMYRNQCYRYTGFSRFFSSVLHHFCTSVHEPRTSISSGFLVLIICQVSFLHLVYILHVPHKFLVCVWFHVRSTVFLWPLVKHLYLQNPKLPINLK